MDKETYTDCKRSISYLVGRLISLVLDQDWNEFDEELKDLMFYRMKMSIYEKKIAQDFLDVYANEIKNKGLQK